ncbi:glycosyltransferase family 4 protein, partial [Armatimonas sp.]|uniref:glycosyltransferase family 4 protein n=1 Tax=Armatimonas sp. TaxID=1872638 RepID=UPI0037534247
IGFFAAFVGLRLFGNLPSPIAPDTRPHLEPLLGIPPHPILGILLGALIVSFIGALDDMTTIGPKDAQGKSMGLSPKLQALGLLFAGLVAALFGARIEGTTNPVPNLIPGSYLSLGWFSVPLTMFWVFLATKTFDFLDGLDGLAAGVGGIAAATMGLMAAFSRTPEPTVALLAATTFGAAVGFLRYNYNPASIFMGTVGSYFLGFMLAMLAVVGAFKVPVAAAVFLPLIVLGVPVFDALYVIGRRAAQGKKITEADKSHIHHRLTERGLSVTKAVWAIYGLTFITCLIALLLVWWGRKP